MVVFDMYIIFLLCYKMWAIPTGTRSVLKKNQSGKESQYVVLRPGNRFGNTNRVGSGFGA